VGKVEEFVSLASGLQTDVVEKLVAVGAQLRLENAYADLIGQARKRLGADTLSTSSQGTIPENQPLTPVYQLATRHGSLVRFETQAPIKVWDASASKWAAPGSALSGVRSYHRGPIMAETSPVYSGVQAGLQVQTPDVATGVGYGFVVFEETDSAAGTIRVHEQIIDLDTKQVVLDERLATGIKFPRAVVVSHYAVCFVNNNGQITADVYNLSSPGPPDQRTFGLCAAGTTLDVRVGSVNNGSTDVSCLYIDNAGKLQCAIVSAAGGGDSTFKVQRTGGTDVSPFGAVWMQDLASSGKFSVIEASTATGMSVLWNLPAPTASISIAAANMVIDATADHVPSVGDGLRQMVGTTTTSNAAGRFRILYDWMDGSGHPTIKACTWDGSAHLSSYFLGVGIVSKLWANDTSFYLWTNYIAEDQSTYFVLGLDSDATTSASYTRAPLATAFVRAAGVALKFFSASSVAIQTDGAIVSSVTHETRTESILGASSTAAGLTVAEMAIDLVSVTHRSAPELEFGKPVEFLDSVFTAGGVLKFYDGSTYGLAGFPYYPHSMDLAAVAGGNLEPSAQYAWRACYSFVDNQGKKWRSAPSAPVQASTTGADFQFTVKLRTLLLVDRGAPQLWDGYQIELYRSQADEADAFFLVASYPNDPTAFDITVTDNVADVDLGEELYTDGNGLENQLLPAISHVVMYQNRLVCAQAGTGTLWYSLDVDLTHGLLFSESLTIDVGDPGAEITGLAVVGDSLIVLKKSIVYAMAGQGGNALGQGATYDFRTLAVGVGCSNAASIVQKEGEAWFKSDSQRAGIHRVTSGLGLTYAGQGVKAYDTNTITAAVIVPHLSQIRFYTGNGTTMVWDWIASIWGTNTEQSAVSAVSGYVGVTGVVYANNTDVLSEATLSSSDPWSEAGSEYRARARSPWLSFAGVDNWERIKRIQGVGTPNGPHKVVISLYRDFDETDVLSHSAKQFDGTETKWTWELLPKVQKLSAMMIDVEIQPYIPDPVTFSPDKNAGDAYLGAGVWVWPDAAFSADMVGGTVVISGDPGLNGTYSIDTVTNATHLVLSPDPGAPASIPGSAVVEITYQPAAVNGPGPGISGVNVTASGKEGQSKLPVARRAT
jgi:hypothetical protein